MIREYLLINDAYAKLTAMGFIDIVNSPDFINKAQGSVICGI
jgi:hypothetical protein